MPNASVLPVPVRAWPIRSVPMSATESVISWIGKGFFDADVNQCVGDLGHDAQIFERSQGLLEFLRLV